ncbi:unnamed protein product [Heterobilharzia americana]|nr:unnamed protein product [Heterobilharzia americana]
MDVYGRDASDHYADTSEGPVKVSQPKYDPFFTRNLRVIEDLLFDEKRYHCTPGFCVLQSPARTTWMRRSLFNWLRDICIHRGTDGEVLAHTAQLIDRYMHLVPTEQDEYQLETVPIALKKVAEYTANSLTEQDVLAKELTIYFIAPVVEFLEFVPSLRQIIRQAALCVFIKVFHVEELGNYMPSYMAAACILYALNLTVHRDLSEVAIRSVTLIQQILKLEARKMRQVYQVLQACFEPGTVQLSNSVLLGDLEPPDSPAPGDPTQMTHQLLPSATQSINAPVLLPMTTSVFIHPHLGVSNQPLLSSVDIPISASMIYVNNGVSFDHISIPTTSASISACSTSSPPSEAETLGLNELENEPSRCAYNNKPRLSMPIIHYPHSRQFCHHSNVTVTGNLRERKLVPLVWESSVSDWTNQYK